MVIYVVANNEGYIKNIFTKIFPNENNTMIWIQQIIWFMLFKTAYTFLNTLYIMISGKLPLLFDVEIKERRCRDKYKYNKNLLQFSCMSFSSLGTFSCVFY